MLVARPDIGRGAAMQLTVKEVAKFLNVSDKTVYRWIDEKNIPFHRIDGQYRFNRTELLEWATSRNLKVSTGLYKRDESVRPPPTVAEALEAGGIFYRLSGTDRASSLRSMIEVLPLPDGESRDDLFQLVMAREGLGSTAIGKGIAIPHVRNPIVLGVNAPRITLCFLERPVDFSAPDRLPVRTLFWMICPTVRTHSHMLARLATLARDPGFQGVLDRQAAKEEILKEARRIESGLSVESGGAK
jgi:PTS system nitrogen regulatory IIA component